MAKSWSLERPVARRLLTITGVFAALAVVTILLPLLGVVAATVDLIRSVGTRRPWMAVRLVGFGWVYLLGEVWAVLALAAVGILPRRSALAATYWLQTRWVGWNFRALRRLFGLSFRSVGEDSIAPGPLILLVRHASLIDSLLPAQFVSKPTGIRFRYVLKKELLADPALDIAGNRLPNHFLDRSSPDSSGELDAIRRLAGGLGPGEGALIYPEGTRYSDAKRLARIAALESEGSPHARTASSMRSVLPPRPGGTMALLEASSADVLVLAPSGLEGFASVRDIWDGGLVGSTIHIGFRRIPRAEIPTDPDSRVRWLFRIWGEVDDWVSARSG